MVKISVIIPFYNRINWLEEAIASVLSQTFGDFEIILINDGSTECFSLDRLLSDTRIRYVEQENLGASIARNRGLDIAEGEYIAFLDADDLFVPEKLKKQLKFMEDRPEIVLSYTSFERIDRDGNSIDIIHSGAHPFNVFPFLFNNCSIALPTVMLRREMVQQSGIRFADSISVGEDILFWAIIAEKFSIAGLDVSLTKVRIHGENAAINPKAQLLANLHFIDHIYKNVEMTSEVRSILSDMYMNCFFYSFSTSTGFTKLLSGKFIIKCLFNNPYNTRFWSEPFIQMKKIMRI